VVPRVELAHSILVLLFHHGWSMHQSWIRPDETAVTMEDMSISLKERKRRTEEDFSEAFGKKHGERSPRRMMSPKIALTQERSGDAARAKVKIDQF
jgi:hypothetical protein